MEVTRPLNPMPTAAKTPAFLFLLIALAVPIPWLVNPKLNPLASIFFNFIKSKTKIPKEAPITPVINVIMAVKDGIPPIIYDIPIAIGAVTLLGRRLKINSLGNSKYNDNKYVTKIAKIDPMNREIKIALLFITIKSHFL